MNNTEKIKTATKNITRKKRTPCPKGQRRVNGICQERKKKAAIISGCSTDYTPETDSEIERVNELKKMNNETLRNMVSNLIGEEEGKTKNQIKGARMKNELISLIVCLENKKEPSIQNNEETPAILPSPIEEEKEEKEEKVEKEDQDKKDQDEDNVIESIQENINNDDIISVDTKINLDTEEQNIQDTIGVEPADIDSKEYNDFLFKKEKLEYENAENDNSYDFLYPDLNDPKFNQKIAMRKEFNDTKFDGKIKDIKKQAEVLCKADFELLPHQMFVKNFLSLQTPYNSLLLYHGLGTGKTCSAIGISEEMRNFMKQIGITQKILIVASPNVQNNFRLQLFDERKLKLDGEQWNLNTCVGNSLLKEINPTNLKGITKDKIVSLVNTLINKYYSFVGYTEFAHYMQKIITPPDNVNYTAQQRKQHKLKKIQKYFDNRLIIIDEVHNIRQSDDNKEKKKTATLLLTVCKYANNLRLLLLSATPMYNSYKEIIWITNVMNSNDNRSTISESDVFDKNGNFIESTTDKNGNVIEGGKELLIRKLTGYVSFVRGENPYSFPYRIYPDTFDSQHTLDLDNYPTKQMNTLTINEPIQHTPVYTNKIGEYQHKGYRFIIDTMKNMHNVNSESNQGVTLPTFENMESFGYTYLERPLQSLDIVYPNAQLDKVINNEESTMNPEDIIKNSVGKNGLKSIMTYTTNEFTRFNFEYKPDVLEKYGRIFHKEHLSKYSGKISSICDTIIKSKGIVMVYSQYIDGGVVPLALALEELGFTRYGSSSFTKPLFSKPPTEPVDSISMKPKSQVKSKFKQAKYVMITGDKLFSPNNADDIKHITNSENKNGENVKVILITKAAAEGLDFKNVRQVHIMEPWYNSNRTEQIIGRGVRNLSHCDLPFELRNVEIYLHTILPTDDEEPADLYVYRFSEKKANLIGNVTRIMKEVSVDCQLNIEQTNFTVEKLTQMAQNQNIKIELSSNPSKKIDFQIGDKPFTAVCDYKDNCEYKCIPNNDIDTNIIEHTYSEDFARIGFSAIVKRIRQLFKEQFFYKRNDLIKSINIVKKYPKEQIDFALTKFVNNKNEIITDKYGRNGYLINKGQYYVFQPMELTDEYISLIERSIPIQFKHKSLELELPKSTSIVTTDIDTGISSITLNDYKTINKHFTENIGKLKTEHTIKSGDNDWYKHLSNVCKHLTKNDFTKEQVNKYAIHHFLDTLPMQDKITVIIHIFQKDIQLTKDEKVIKKYYETFMTKDKNAFILIDVFTPKSPFKIYTIDHNANPILTQDDDIKKYKDDLKNFIVADTSKINTNIFGFIDKDNKQNIIFKTRNTGDKLRNISGFNCNTSGKNDIIKKINDLPINMNLDYDSIKKQGTCVIYEMIFRKLDEDKLNGKRWFFDKVLRNRDVDTFIGKTKP